MSDKKFREFWLFKNGTGCADPDYQAKRPDKTIEQDFIHAIEHAALAEKDAEVAELVEEIEFLRRYGNKDCTGMADEALAKHKGARGE